MGFFSIKRVGGLTFVSVGRYRVSFCRVSDAALDRKAHCVKHGSIWFDMRRSWDRADLAEMQRLGVQTFPALWKAQTDEAIRSIEARNAYHAQWGCD